MEKSSKGNPAHHRIGNVARKARRVASWTRADQLAQHDANQMRRANGEPTPWEVAKAKRAERRAAKRWTKSAA